MNLDEDIKLFEENSSSKISSKSNSEGIFREKHIFSSSINLILVDLSKKQNISLNHWINPEISIGDTVVLGESWDETITLLNQYSFDVILFNGLDPALNLQKTLVPLLEQVKIPVLVVSPDSEAFIVSVLQLGVQDYLTVFDLQDYRHVRSVVERAIARHRFHSQGFNTQGLNSVSATQTLSTETVQGVSLAKQHVKPNWIESESRFYLLSDTAPIGIFQTDAQGQIVYTNACLQEISGLNPQESLSQIWTTLLHPDDKLKVMTAFQNFIQGIADFYLEFRLMRFQTDERWVLGQAASLRNPKGEICGHVGTITDITLHKQAEQTLKTLNLNLENCVAARTSQLRQANFKLRLENTIRRYHTSERKRVEVALNQAQEQLRAVLDAVPGCVAWVDADLKYLGVNHHMARLMQTPSEYFVGKHIGFSGQLTKELTHFIQYFFETSIDQIGHAVDEIEVELQGTMRHYLVVGQKYLQGNAAVFVGIDITERKNAENEIRNSLINAQEINELKSRFISVVSHEFRTPLTTILTAAELLEHYSQQWPIEKNHAYLRQIQNSVKRMTELLEDVLIISAEEAGKLKINPVSLDIVSFCQSFIEDLRLSTGRNHPLRFRSEITSQQVTLDEKLFRLILNNLISNALKYSPAGNPVEVELEAAHKQIKLTVSDRGIGIPSEDQQYLFELFHRAQNVGTTPGTGLGLAIVKKAVDLHGGKIEVQSEMGVGTQFTVTLPFQPLTKEYHW